MIALSFLGLGSYNVESKKYFYQTTKYQYNNLIVETNHFSYAIKKFLNPEKLFVIMTEKAKEAHSNDLHKLCDFQEIIIPDGKSEDEFWEIFDIITEHIDVNQDVIFDITHGFRSQPIIVIVLLLYLKNLKNIKIKNILYGAFEAKNENNITPVFELKQFVNLIEWSNATREFLINGKLKNFKELLDQIHIETYKNNLPVKSKILKTVGKNLEEMSNSFSTLRIYDIFGAASNFSENLNQLRIDLSNHHKTKPFAKLLDKIIEKMDPISDAEGDVFSTKGLNAQKTIITWYLETQNYQKALTLAREFLISYHMLFNMKIPKEKLVKKEYREEAENELYHLRISLQNQELEPDSSIGKFVLIWDKILTCRNDVNHASMRNKKEALTSKAVISQTKEIVLGINNL